MPPMLRLAFCTVLSDIPASAAAFTMSSLASSFPPASKSSISLFGLARSWWRCAARAGQQLVGGDVVFAYPLKARFRVKEKATGLSSGAREDLSWTITRTFGLSLHAPDKKDAPDCRAEVDRT